LLRHESISTAAQAPVLSSEFLARAVLIAAVAAVFRRVARPNRARRARAERVARVAQVVIQQDVCLRQGLVYGRLLYFYNTRVVAKPPDVSVLT